MPFLDPASSLLEFASLPREKLDPVKNFLMRQNPFLHLQLQILRLSPEVYVVAEYARWDPTQETIVIWNPITLPESPEAIEVQNQIQMQTLTLQEQMDTSSRNLISLWIPPQLRDHPELQTTLWKQIPGVILILTHLTQPLLPETLPLRIHLDSVWHLRVRTSGESQSWAHYEPYQATEELLKHLEPARRWAAEQHRLSHDVLGSMVTTLRITDLQSHSASEQRVPEEATAEIKMWMGSQVKLKPLQELVRSWFPSPLQLEVLFPTPQTMTRSDLYRTHPWWTEMQEWLSRRSSYPLMESRACTDRGLLTLRTHQPVWEISFQDPELTHDLLQELLTR